MSIAIHSFSLEHYEHMVESGAFAGRFQKRVELIHGEIVNLAPIGTRHSNCVTLLSDWSYEVVPLDRIAIRSQNPIRIPNSDSCPEPDLAWVTRRDFANRHPGPEEVVLLAEVAESSLEADRGYKLEVYAEAAIPEYWIINLVANQIEVYRQPHGKSYLEKTIARDDDLVHPLALPEASLCPARLFGGK